PVRDQEIRPEADDCDAGVPVERERERLRELFVGLGTREPARGPAGAERREARERDVLLDRHASSSSRSGTAASTFPAPTVSTTSPGRARRASQRAPSRASGIQPTRVPRTSSTTSLPVTPGSGCSRAGYTSAIATA